MTEEADIRRSQVKLKGAIEDLGEVIKGEDKKTINVNRGQLGDARVALKLSYNEFRTFW